MLTNLHGNRKAMCVNLWTREIGTTSTVRVVTLYLCVCVWDVDP